jgi:hypothetical protein
MHVIGHDYPGSELIKMPSGLAVQKSVSHHTCYSGIPQPNGAESGFVDFAVKGEESPAGG